MTSAPRTKPAKPEKTSGAAPALNEWGISDWRDPSSYGDTKGWSNNRWRWEFYRRRHDVRHVFDQFAPGSLQIQHRQADLFGDPAPSEISEPGFSIELDRRLSLEFGYPRLPNPRIGDQPKHAITTIRGDAVKGDGAVRMPAVQTLQDVLRIANIHLTDEQKQGLLWDEGQKLLVIEPVEIAIAFSSNRPLAPQAQSATAWLKEIYAREGWSIQRRRHPKKWLDYLRILDAKEAGATLQEIAEIFHAQGVLSRYKNPTGGYSPPPPQAAGALLQAARALQSNF
jgi:hypothetical protein